MKEELLGVIRGAAGPALKVHLAREYLQARLLLGLQEAGAMIPLAFQGGTALRFLFGLPRFSEDLDFALERPGRGGRGARGGPGGFDLDEVGARLTARLKREGYEAISKFRTHRAVQSVTVSFPRLLFEAGLSPHSEQRLAIRIEVDTRPPAGAGLETTILRRHVLLNLQHHDRASLLAGKLHAILRRRWTKGRHLFDLFWYLSDSTWPAPNLTLLNSALRQSGWKRQELEASTWRRVVGDRVAALDWKAAERDVAPFLEPGPAVALFGRDSLLQLLRTSLAP